MIDRTSNIPFRQAFKALRQLLKLEKKDIFAIYSFSIFSGLLYLALPLGIQSIVGFVMAGSISTSIFVLVFAVLIALFLNGLLQIRQLELIEKIEQKIFTRYAFAYTESLPSLDLQKMDSYYLPELVNRFFDVSTVQKSIYKLLLDVPGAIVQIVLGTLLLAFYHPFFIAFGLLLLFLVTIIIFATSAKGLATSNSTSDYKYETGAWIEDIARNVRTFKYNKSQNFNLNRLDNIVEAYLVNKSNHFRVLKVQYWSLIGFKIIIVAGMLLLGINLLINQEINIGQFIAADIVILAIISSVEKFIGSFDKLYDALTGLQKLSKITEAPREHSGTFTLPQNVEPLSLQFDNVSFSYSNDFNVLNNLSFALDKSHWLYISGEKRSGKSSIFNLLSGSYQNFEGNILINQLPIGNFDVNSLRSNTGILFQGNSIFTGNILENITFSKDLNNLPHVLELVKYTGLLKFIQVENLGLDTQLDPYSRRLKPEIMQAIFLTRALFANPPLLLLEDPFIFLNAVQKDKLVNYIKTQMKSTVIVINNIGNDEQYCDQLIKLEI